MIRPFPFVWTADRCALCMRSPEAALLSLNFQQILYMLEELQKLTCIPTILSTFKSYNRGTKVLGHPQHMQAFEIIAALLW